MNKLDDLITMAKKYDIKDIKDLKDLKELFSHKEEVKKKDNTLLWVFAIIGVIVAVAGIAYLVYQYLVPDYLEDYDEDGKDDFDDDFFEDEEDDNDTKSWDETEKEAEKKETSETPAE